MGKYRVTAKPTFLTQYNVYLLQRKSWICWRTIADFRNVNEALELKRILQEDET